MTKAATPLSVRARSAATIRDLLRIGLVVADPDFEEIAQDVERIGARALGAQELAELLRRVGRARVEVHVRDEDASHAGAWTDGHGA